jgi:gamma-glutamyltranspeptidase/glutathione hydrolase
MAERAALPPSLGARYGRRGMVCSTDHLASGAGIAVLRAGGSAADAAIAASAVVGVTQPYQCGPGGDLFALVHDGTGPPQALDAAGRAGAGASAAADALRREGHRTVPLKGDVRAVTVPGCVDGWIALHERHGRLPLADVLSPAVELALHGYPAGPFLVAMATLVQEVPGAEAVAAVAGKPPGTLVRRPDLAATLAAIGTDGRTAFYQGAFGEALLHLGGGLYDRRDLAEDGARWVDPISLDAWGHRIWTMPAPSQGYLALLGAAVAEQVDLPTDPRDPQWAHLGVEAARAAAHDRPSLLHDAADLQALLSHREVEDRAARIDPDHANPWPSPSLEGDTIYLCAVDEDRLAVSLIQSNASGFGAHLVAGDTGVFLHDRGLGFSLEPGHPAELAPGRKPPHTLSPLLVTSTQDELRAVVGTMGGDSQPQILLQLLARLLHAGQDPGQALRAARWALTSGTDQGFDTWAGPNHVGIEANAPQTWAQGLEQRGHSVVPRPEWDAGVGMAHAITVTPDDSVLSGASDPRAPEAAALAY